MNRGHVQQVVEFLEPHELLQNDIDCLNAAGKRQPILLEVFVGSMHLSHVAAQRGWKVLQPVDISIDGCDLTQVESQQVLNEEIQRWKPDFISWAPPCGPYSPLQQIMPKDRVKRIAKTLRLKRKRKTTDKLWKYCHQHFHKQAEAIKKSVGDNQTIHMVETRGLLRLGNIFGLLDT